ncbi:MAG: LytTR family transcriptional regulator DNA-binding domain-containing protein [bacterium]|nr:LytTR family transcriptional regulator DNA-binding domain-containing protein [bacterium]
MTFRTLCILRPDGAARLHLLLASVIGHDVRIVSETDNADNIEMMCDELRPDLIFYDPSIDSGALLYVRLAAPSRTPIIACFTKDVSYAVDAFEAGAVHYLLATADTFAVEAALERATRRMTTYASRNTSSMIMREPSAQMARVIALPLQDGIDIRPCEQIVHVHGEGSYARVVFQRDPAIIVSRSIGDCEETLRDRGFLRVHRSHLVNLIHVRRVLRGKQQRLCMSNGDEVDISDRYRESLMSHLNVIARRGR